MIVSCFDGLCPPFLAINSEPNLTTKLVSEVVLAYKLTAAYKASLNLCLRSVLCFYEYNTSIHQIIPTFKALLKFIIFLIKFRIPLKEKKDRKNPLRIMVSIFIQVFFFFKDVSQYQ